MQKPLSTAEREDIAKEFADAVNNGCSRAGGMAAARAKMSPDRPDPATSSSLSRRDQRRGVLLAAEPLAFPEPEPFTVPLLPVTDPARSPEAAPLAEPAALPTRLNAMVDWLRTEPAVDATRLRVALTVLVAAVRAFPTVLVVMLRAEPTVFAI